MPLYPHAHNSIAMLRQHLPSTHRIQIVMKGSERFSSSSKFRKIIMDYSLTFSCTESIVYLGKSESSDEWRDNRSYRHGSQMSQGRCSVIWLFVRDQARTYSYGNAAVGGVPRLCHSSHRGLMGQGRVSRRQDADYGGYRLGMLCPGQLILVTNTELQGNGSYLMPSSHPLNYIPEAIAGDSSLTCTL